MGEYHGTDAIRAYNESGGTDSFTVRFTNSGTQTGPFMGVAPSGTHADWTGIGIYTSPAGKITEGWFGEDILGMLLQLGVLSLPSQ
jgi:predicted ester cyclase